MERSVLRAQLNATLACLCIFSMVGGVVGCEVKAPEPSVTYRGGPPLGTWVAPIQSAGEGGTAGDGALAGAASVPVGGMGGVVSGGAGGVGAAGMAASGQGGTSGVGAAGTGGPGASGEGGSSGVGSPAGSGGSSGMGATSVSMLSFDVLTHSQGGKYSPKNIGAIWIETSGGEFVRTLEVWAERRVRYLSRWNSEAGASRVDAVSGATLRSHVTHSVTWDLTDAVGSAVAAGDYKIVIEATDRDAKGASQEVPFTLGEPQTVAVPDVPAFSAMSVTLE